jgi:hypothetical protein
VLVFSVSEGCHRPGLFACGEQFSEPEDGPQGHNRPGVPPPPLIFIVVLDYGDEVVYSFVRGVNETVQVTKLTEFILYFEEDLHPGNRIDVQVDIEIGFLIDIFFKGDFF